MRRRMNTLTERFHRDEKILLLLRRLFEYHKLFLIPSKIRKVLLKLYHSSAIDSNQTDVIFFAIGIETNGQERFAMGASRILII